MPYQQPTAVLGSQTTDCWVRFADNRHSNRKDAMEKFYAHQIFIATFLLLLELMRGMCNCLCRVLVIISMCV